MKCKSCGGELCYQNGRFLCESCSVEITLDTIYEQIDVYLCYEENDANGRRTKDSIIAQEVYNKLESSKIKTFYERISADGLTGDDLEVSRATAINKAKVVIVLATSVDNFSVLEEKYSALFVDKKVIPFCVDITPDKIPKTLSSIQAINYSSIGWDKDLISGLCNILGREKKLDTGKLFDKTRKKLIIIISIVSAVILIGISVAGVILFGNDGENNDTETIQIETKVLTDKEIYENATELLNNGKYLEAAERFKKIIDYKDSSNQIKKIYDRYDGYYQDNNKTYSLYLNIIDGETIDFTFEKNTDNKVIKAEDSLIMNNNCASGEYIDNLLNEGSISISISNEYIDLYIFTEETNNDVCFEEANVQFDISSKLDSPSIKSVTKEMLLSWIDSPTDIDDIKAAGYDLEYIPAQGEIDQRFGTEYIITNTDVKVIMTDSDLTTYTGSDIYNLPKRDSSVVVAVIAPVDLICPEKIGEAAIVIEDDDIAYVPNAFMFSPMYDYNHNYFLNFYVDGFSEMSNTADKRTLSEVVINSDSMIGISSNSLIGDFNYSRLVSINKDIYHRTIS